MLDMRARVATLITCGVCTLAGARSGGAQSAGDYAAYVALLSTPIAGLPPVMTSTVTGTLQEGVQFAVRYGFLKHMAVPTAGGFDRSDVELNNFGATAVLPVGLGSTLSFTGGAWYPTCEGCDAHLMLSVAGDMRLGAKAIGDQPNPTLLMLGLSGEAGYANPSSGTVMAGTVGVPISLVARLSQMRIVPFVTPSFGFGSSYASGGVNESGSRFHVGGGVGVFNPASTLAINLGFQYIDFPGTTAQWGVTIRLGGG